MIDVEFHGGPYDGDMQTVQDCREIVVHMCSGIPTLVSPPTVDAKVEALEIRMGVYKFAYWRGETKVMRWMGER